MLQVHNENKKSSSVKTLLGYNVMLYYRVANCKCDRWETLPLPYLAWAFWTLHSRVLGGSLLDPLPISSDSN